MLFKPKHPQIVLAASAVLLSIGLGIWLFASYAFTEYEFNTDPTPERPNTNTDSITDFTEQNANNTDVNPVNTNETQAAVTSSQKTDLSGLAETSEAKTEAAETPSSTTPTTTPEPPKIEQTQEPEPEPPKTISVTVAAGGGGVSFSAKVEVNEGATVLQAMQAAKAKGFSYTTKQFASLGTYVEAVLGVKESKDDGMYWIYYVNGVKANTGISSRTLKAGDSVSWRYERGQ